MSLRDLLLYVKGQGDAKKQSYAQNLDIQPINQYSVLNADKTGGDLYQDWSDISVKPDPKAGRFGVAAANNVRLQHQLGRMDQALGLQDYRDKLSVGREFQGPHWLNQNSYYDPVTRIRGTYTEPRFLGENNPLNIKGGWSYEMLDDSGRMHPYHYDEGTQPPSPPANRPTEASPDTVVAKPSLISELMESENRGAVPNLLRGVSDIYNTTKYGASLLGDQLSPYLDAAKLAYSSIGDEAKRLAITGEPPPSGIQTPNLPVNLGVNIGARAASQISPEAKAKMRAQLELIGRFLSGVGRTAVGGPRAFQP